ncbi:uncharacterized protein LOC142774848 [Rhipicephalus microplus]|uniref:uncharacterized protein LOC142774848 n=1 Tax=Rhipicephalus microplus TaxID=6941 RepID=UPI003F6D616C
MASGRGYHHHVSSQHACHALICARLPSAFVSLISTSLSRLNAAMSEESAKTTSQVPHTVDATVEGDTAEHATKEPTKEGAGTDHGTAEKGNEPAATETHVSSVERKPSSEHAVSEKDAKHKALGLEHAPPVAGERRPSRKSSAEGAKPTTHASTEHGSNALSPEHASSVVGDKQLSRMSSAESAAAKSIGHTSAHAGANRAKANAKRTRSEVDTERSGSKIDTDRSGSKVGATRSVEHVTIEPSTGPVTERSKIEPNTKADESSKAGRRVVLRMATREVSTPGTGRIIELVAFAVIVAVIVMIGAAIFNAAYGRDPKDARIRGGDDLLGTAIYRGHRSWHGYGPQLLVCVLGERRSVIAPESLPPDGLCDVVLYAHVSSLGPEFQAGASENLRALWTRAATAVHTRFGYSFSDSLLPVDEQDLESFVRRAVDEKKIGAFGMLDARWERHVGDNEAYVSFVASLNRTTKKLPNDHRAALVFGFRVDPATSARGIEFSNSHAAILDHVHVLVYQGHVELPRQNDSAESPCAVRFPSPRFQQAVDSDQTMQVNRLSRLI